MFQTLARVALVALVAVVCLATATAAEPKETGVKPKDPPKELTMDLAKGIKLEMVLIPAGEFMMGSPNSDILSDKDEKPQHRVRITKPFYLGKYLVTQEQWEAVMGRNPSNFKDPKKPVEQISWDDCQQFVDKLNQRIFRPHSGSLQPVAHGEMGEGMFRLPTEAQWEYACRAGSKTRYSYGDDESRLGEYAWHDKNSGKTSNRVGERKPNAWGLYDTHGNVWEWCADWYDGKYYACSPTDDPTGPTTGSDHVLRGGGWCDPAGDCRSAYRFNYGPANGIDFVGCRVSLAISEK